MKKIVLLVAVLAMSISMSAQTVSPLNVRLTEFNLDTMRIYAESPEALQQNLLNLQRAIEGDKDAIALAKNTIKSEQAYYKNQVSLHKDKEKQLKSQETFYKKEDKNAKKERKAIEKERKAFNKNTTISQDMVDRNIRALNDRVARLDQDANIRSQKLMNIQKERDNLKNDMISMAEYNYALQTKQTELKNLINKNKLDAANVKTELKSVKAQIKAQK